MPLYNDQYFFTGRVIEDFETGNLEKFHWYLEGDKDWEINNQSSSDGDYSAIISDLDHNQKASINLDYYFGADSYIWFSVQIISEKNDILCFYVNDSLIQSWLSPIFFGFGPEQKVLIPKGQNKLSWEYSKNESISIGSDAVWIDRIILPPIDSIPGLGFQEIKYNDYINISPMPTKGLINIKNNHTSPINMIEIIGMDGQLVQQIKENFQPNTRSSIDLAHLAKGCYILKLISSKGEIFTDKLIIE